MEQSNFLALVWQQLTSRVGTNWNRFMMLYEIGYILNMETRDDTNPKNSSQCGAWKASCTKRTTTCANIRPGTNQVSWLSWVASFQHWSGNNIYSTNWLWKLVYICGTLSIVIPKKDSEKLIFQIGTGHINIYKISTENSYFLNAYYVVGAGE